MPTFVAVFACSFSVVESLFWIFLVDVPVALGSSFALDGAVGQLESECLLQHVAGLVLPFRCLPFIAQPSLCFLFLRPLPDTIISLMLAFCLLAHPRTLGGSLGFASPVPDGSVGRVFQSFVVGIWMSFEWFLHVSPLCLPSDHLVDSVHFLQGSAASPLSFHHRLVNFFIGDHFFLFILPCFWYCDPCFIVCLFFLTTRIFGCLLTVSPTKDIDHTFVPYS